MADDGPSKSGLGSSRGHQSSAPSLQHSSLGNGPTAVPEYFARILKNKDRIIRVQAKRIEILETEVERLRVTREQLNSQLAVLSYKLELATEHSRDEQIGNANEFDRYGMGVAFLWFISYLVVVEIMQAKCTTYR